VSLFLKFFYNFRWNSQIVPERFIIKEQIFHKIRFPLKFDLFDNPVIIEQVNYTAQDKEMQSILVENSKHRGAYKRKGAMYRLPAYPRISNQVNTPRRG
jgi:hypothetical protein